MDRGITQERLSRLPRWAADEITRLDREARELRSDIEQMRGEVGDTNTYADPHRSLATSESDPHDRGLPLRRNEQVRFYLSDDKRPDEYIDVRVENGWLWIHGGAGLKMKIRASNTVYLRSER